MNRRDFILKNMILAGAGATGLSSCISSKNDFLIGWRSDLYRFKSRDSILNLMGHDVESLELSSMSHDLLKIRKDLVISIPKWGKKADIIDLKTYKIVKTITVEGNEEFMGHGVIDLKQKRLYISAIELKAENYVLQGTGFIHEYDLENYKFIGKFSSHGKQPHEMAIVDNKLLVLNPSLDQLKKADKPNVALIDLKTKKLDYKHLPKDSSLLYSHLVKVDNSTVFMINERAEGDDDNLITALLYQKGKFRQLSGPSKIFNEGGLLSADVGEKYVVVTAPQDNCIVIWDKDFHYLKYIKLNNPKAISYDTNLKSFLIGCADGVYSFNEVNNKVKRIYEINFQESASSHGLVL